MPSDIYRDIGVRVRQERHRLGWTQEELGERCGMHASFVGQLERGVKKISIASLQRLSRALGAPMARLLGEESAPPDTWESKFGGLLRDTSERERRLLYSTLRHMARGLRGGHDAGAL